LELLKSEKDNRELLSLVREGIILSELCAEHAGSLDIDIALDFKHIDSAAYKSILQLLNERGYTQGEQPFIFYRNIQIGTGRVVPIKIDLLAGEYGGTSKSHRTQGIQEVRARKARGCDLVFDN
jgi:hypothetical protein